MAYAILKTGGKQYRVRPGDVIDVDKLPVDPGSSIEFGDVLAVSKEDGIVLGAPVVANATVLANVRDQIRDDKIIVFKYKRKVRYRVKRGHRQPYTRVAITAIMLDGEDVDSHGSADAVVPADVEIEQPVDEVAAEEPVDETEEPDAEPMDDEASDEETPEDQEVEEVTGEASEEAAGEEESGNGS